MTMPEFDPVAWRYELKASEYTFAEKRYLNETYAPRPTALHTAGQLTEAYEAGKREASEDIEQAAFNFGKRESAVLIERQAVQIEMMREALGYRIDHPKVITALSTTPNQALEEFAAKVREQCAKLCDDLVSDYPSRTDITATQCADAIRAIKELP